MADFVWGEGGGQLTPDQIAAQRKIAAALMKQGMDYSPVQSWTQGAARVAQALLGGYEDREADTATKTNAAKDAETIAALVGGGAPGGSTAVTAAAPAAGLAPTAGPTPQPMAPSVSGKIYSNDEASPLDPPDAQARDMAIRTVYGEDPGQSALAVANVIRNRAINGGFGGDTVPGVVLAKNQFEPWNNAAARGRMESLDPNSPTYQRLGQVVDQAYAPGGNDPTNGATMFYSPTAQAALGRNVPAWAQGQGQDIGEHRFYGGATPQAVQAAQAGVPADDGETTIPANATATVGSLPPQFGGTDRQLAAPQPLGPNTPAVSLAPAAPAQMAQASPQAASPVPPAAIPAQAAPTPAAAVAPSAARSKLASIAAVMGNPYASPQTKAVAAIMLKKAMTEDKFGFQALPDGTVLRTDPKTGTVAPIYHGVTKPSVVAPGGTAIDASGRVVYQNAEKPPTSVSEYEYYKANLPSGAQAMPFDQWATAKARAGATNISNNFDPNASQSYDKQLAEGLAKSHAALANGVEDAQGRARDIAAMQGALDTIQKNGGTTGGLGQAQVLELKKTINSGAAALGINNPFNENDISDKEFLQKFNRQIAGQQAKGAVGSRVTNFEMTNYLKSNPGLEMSVTGNQRLLGINAQIEQRNIAVGNQIRQATAQAISAGKKIDPVTVQKIITDYDQGHHITDPVNGQDLTQSYTLPEFQKPGMGTNAALAVGHATNINGIKIKRVN